VPKVASQGDVFTDSVRDAGLGIKDVDGIAFFAGGYEAGLICEHLGIDGLTFAHVVSGFGSSMAGIFDLAAMAIETGRTETALCIGAIKQPAHKRTGQALALQARRHMHGYGTRREAFGEVVLASRAAAANRETALRRKPLTMEEYLASPMLADPLCRLDFCLETGGALVFVVTSAERARDLRQKPVYIEAAAQVGKRDWGRAFFWLNQSEDAFTTAGGGPVAEHLYAKTGLTPKDIDVALIYDHFSPLVVMQLEDYGFCAAKVGLSSKAVRSGSTARFRSIRTAGISRRVTSLA
jgi:acetyl-CoA acetyltransferase